MTDIKLTNGKTVVMLDGMFLVQGPNDDRPFMPEREDMEAVRQTLLSQQREIEQLTAENERLKAESTPSTELQRLHIQAEINQVQRFFDETPAESVICRNSWSHRLETLRDELTSLEPMQEAEN